MPRYEEEAGADSLKEKTDIGWKARLSVLFIGVGDIAQALAKMLTGFDCNVISLHIPSAPGTFCSKEYVIKH